MKKIKLYLYWISVIPPILDLIRGAVRGVKMGLADLERERENARFDKANNGSV